jgi:hypothetical protein
MGMGAGCHTPLYRAGGLPATAGLIDNG